MAAWLRETVGIGTWENNKAALEGAYDSPCWQGLLDCSYNAGCRQWRMPLNDANQADPG